MRKLASLLLVLTPLLAGCSSARFHCPTGFDPSARTDRPLAVPRVDCPEGAAAGYKPKNLVFQGGGVKGIAYAGSLQVLENEGILDGVTAVAGTSAGAITATLVALGYGYEEIQEMLLELDFTRFEDGGAGGIFRIFRRYGFFKGNYFLSWMRCKVFQKTKLERATFRDLWDLNAGRDEEERLPELRLFTTDVNAGKIQELSYRETPDLEVALAARMSMSIPLFFASIEHEAFGTTPEKERHVFVDGGVLYNYPVGTFDEDDINYQTLGFVLADVAPAHKPAKEIDSLLSYSRALVEADLNVQVAELQVDRPNLCRTAVMDDLDVSTTDFKLSPQTKKKLIKSGVRCTCEFLQKRPKVGTKNPCGSPPPPGLNQVTTYFSKCGWVVDGGAGGMP